MFAKISIGQLCGFLFLFILLTSVLSQFLAGAALDPQDVPGTLGKLAANGKKFRISVVIDLISHVSIIALAGLLYIAFSPYNQPLALLGTLWRRARSSPSVRSATSCFSMFRRSPLLLQAYRLSRWNRWGGLSSRWDNMAIRLGWHF